MRAVVLAAFVAIACGAPSKDPTMTTPPTASSSPPVAMAPVASSAAPLTTPPPETKDAFASLEPDFTRCYEDGKRAVPTMTSGRITFHASVDASGKTTCAVPSDDTGLTQEVENCMRLRLDKERFPKKDTPYSLALPIVVRDGKLARAELRDTPSAIETIESQGLAEDVYDVVETLLPSLYQCVATMKSGSARVITVGARVSATGQVECALASGPAAVPSDTRTCIEKTFAKAKFGAPKKGYGLLSVPLNLSR